MTNQERGELLASTPWQQALHITRALDEAEARGRRQGLEEAADWVAKNVLAHSYEHGSVSDVIRALSSAADSDQEKK